jgi:hypothetical protein
MARPTLKGLARQRWRYGWWKAAVLSAYPQSLHARQAIPILGLLGLVTLLITAAFSPSYFELLAYLSYMYAAVCTVSGLHTLSTTHEWTGKSRTVLTTLVLAPLIYAIIHGVWAAGAVAGLAGNRRLSRP